MNVTASCFGLELYKKNNYEPFSTDLVKYLLKPGALFVDIGAYYGYYSLLAYQSQEDVKVIAFEPAKENFDILKMNLKHNKAKNFEIYNLAASNREGIYPFNFTEASDCAGFHKHYLTSVREIINVSTITGDKVLNGRAASFIKIDVEGHEIAVLEGLGKSLKNKDVTLLIEFNPTLHEIEGHKPEELLDFIKDQGFSIFVLDEFNKKYHRLTKSSSWRQIEKRSSYEDYCTNLLCIKKENTVLISYFESVAKLISQIHEGSKLRREQAENFQKRLEDLQIRLNQDEEFIKAIKSSKVYKLRESYHRVRKVFK